MPTPTDSVRAHIRASQQRHRQIREAMRGQEVPYFRRGEMSIPAFRLPPGGDPETDGRAASLRMMGKAASLPIDFFFYDLEDATPDHPDFKPLARALCIEALTTLDFGGRVRAFRPNNLRTEWFEGDLVEVVEAAGDRLDAIVLPKTESADEVRDVQEALRALQRLSGRDRRLSIEVLIESPRAFVAAEQIAAIEDVSALIYGAWDFSRTVGSTVHPETWLSDHSMARQTLPVIAAAHGKEAVDAVTATLPIRPRGDDAGARERYGYALALARRDAEEARRIGYAAKWILHPDQIEPIHAAWTPDPEVARDALQLAVSYAAAAHRGSGAEVHADQLADKAVVGTAFWTVRAALGAGVLGEADVAATGIDLAALERTLRTRD